MHRQTRLLSTALFLVAGAFPTVAAAEILLDYRDAAFLSGNPFYPQAKRAEIAAALKTAPDGLADALGADFALRGDATGSFAATGSAEHVYLVQEEAAVAIEPFPDAAAPVLVVLRDGEPAGFYRLGKEVQYQRLVAAADIDGDGKDEVFLETSFTNMGQTTMSLDVVSLREGGTAEVVQTLSEIYQDGCENPVGARERKASTISVSKGVTAESYTQACPQ